MAGIRPRRSQRRRSNAEIAEIAERLDGNRDSVISAISALTGFLVVPQNDRNGVGEMAKTTFNAEIAENAESG
jgi:hypothetical protein